MPPRRRVSATLPERNRPSLRHRLLLGALLVLATVLLAQLASWVLRVPYVPVRAERVIPVR